jgi:predicted nucleotidyltransferase
MKTEWPKATTQQRAAAEKLVRSLHSQYPGRILLTVLFGSVARGDFTADSDIDVLVIADKVDTDLKWNTWGIGAQISLECDVIFNLHIYSYAHWASLRDQHRPLYRNVEQDGIELTLQAAPA